MNFSICLASRERSQLLMALLESIKNTTADIENVEVLVAVDDCDAESLDCRVHAEKKYNFVKFFIRPRSQYLNRDYINWVYDITGRKGKFFIACNDDVIFRTKNWDKIAINKIEDYLKDKPDRICYSFVSDCILNRHGQNYTCFPLLSKEGIEALGFAMEPNFRSWNCDLCMNKIYSGVNRRLDLSEIILEHVSYHAGTRSRDNVSYHVQNICNNYDAPIGEYIKRLQDVITQSKK